MQIGFIQFVFVQNEARLGSHPAYQHVNCNNSLLLRQCRQPTSFTPKPPRKIATKRESSTDQDADETGIARVCTIGTHQSRQIEYCATQSIYPKISDDLVGMLKEAKRGRDAVKYAFTSQAIRRKCILKQKYRPRTIWPRNGHGRYTPICRLVLQSVVLAGRKRQLSSIKPNDSHMGIQISCVYSKTMCSFAQGSEGQSTNQPQSALPAVVRMLLVGRTLIAI